MKRSLRLPRDAIVKYVWLLIAVFVAVIALFCSLGPSTSASGHSPVEPLGPFPAVLPVLAGGSWASNPAVISDTLQPSVGIGVESTVSLTHTLLLPLIRRGHWEAPDSLLGVQVYSSDPEAEMRMTQMGARWARLPISWASIEPQNTEPISYQWSISFDNWLARLSTRNIRVILTLRGNPSWAATYPGGPIDLVDISELAQFMAAAVARYGQPPYNVKHWEFYNEPDCGHDSCGEFGFSYWGHEPDAYAEMLSAVYGPIKVADPEAQIVFGGIAYDWWIEDGGPFAKEFLDGVLAADGGDFFDVMNYHYYPSFHATWDPYGPGIIGKATYIRDQLSYYDVDKPLVCTETSLWSNELPGSSPELQSRYVPQVFARSMATDLQIAIWFTLIDSDDVGMLRYGLLNPDLSPKPSYYAYQTFARQMAFADFVRSLDPGDTGSDQIEAYDFLTQKGPTRIIVAWTKDEQEHEMALLADQVLVVDKFGVESTVYDGDDGLVDGYVQVAIGPSPLYLRVR